MGLVLLLYPGLEVFLPYFSSLDPFPYSARFSPFLCSEGFLKMCWLGSVLVVVEPILVRQTWRDTLTARANGAWLRVVE